MAKSGPGGKRSKVRSRPGEDSSCSSPVLSPAATSAPLGEIPSWAASRTSASSLATAGSSYCGSRLRSPLSARRRSCTTCRLAAAPRSRSRRLSSASTKGTTPSSARTKASAAASGATPLRVPGGTVKPGKSIKPARSRPVHGGRSRPKLRSSPTSSATRVPAQLTSSAGRSRPRAKYSSSRIGKCPSTGISGGRARGSPVKRRGTTEKRLGTGPRAMPSKMSMDTPLARIAPRSSAARYSVSRRAPSMRKAESCSSETMISVKVSPL